MINMWYLQRMEQIIPPYPESLHLQNVVDKIETELKKEGKEIPPTLDAIIRNVYNQNCEGYSDFEKKRVRGAKAIFKSKNKGDGHWSKHPDYKPVEPLSLDDF